MIPTMGLSEYTARQPSDTTTPLNPTGDKNNPIQTWGPGSPIPECQKLDQ